MSNLNKCLGHLTPRMRAILGLVGYMDLTDVIPLCSHLSPLSCFLICATDWSVCVFIPILRE
jgi:hypothetical protein